MMMREKEKEKKKKKRRQKKVGIDSIETEQIAFSLNYRLQVLNG